VARWSNLSRAERRLNAIVVAGVLLPLGLSAYALSMSFAFRPEAIARGEHLSLIGVSLPPCPGCSLCGMSRAFSAFAHADFAGAVAYHPGVLVTFPLFWVLAAVCVFGLYRFARMPLRLPMKEIRSHHAN